MSDSDNRPRLTDELRAKVQTLIEKTELVDIRPVRILADLDKGAPSDVHGTSFSMAVAFALDAGMFGTKFDYAFHLTGADGAQVGTVEFSLVVDYRVTDADYCADEEAADFFASTTAYLACFPYARELFHTLTSRLQLDPLVLGMLRRGSYEPRTITPHSTLRWDDQASELEED